MRSFATRRLVVMVSVLVVFSAATAALATGAGSASRTLHLGGSWSGTYSGAYAGKFTLTWTQSPSGRLTGSISLSNPKGLYPISGHVQRSAISFGVVAAGATYTGSATTLKMSGSFMTPGGGGSWSAHKLPTVVRLK